MKRLLLAAIFMLTAACQKVDSDAENHPAPRMAMPSPGASSDAQGRVEASSGPIKLALELHRTHTPLVPLQDSSREAAIFFRATLTNIGTEFILLREKIFSDPMSMPEGTGKEAGVYLDLRDSRNKPVERLLDVHRHDPRAVNGDGLTREQRAMILERAMSLWDAASGSTRSVKAPIEIDRPKDFLQLDPGQSVSNPTWVSARAGRIKPVPGYAQAPFYLSKPGRYKIRLVYSWEPPGILRTYEKKGIRISPQHLWLATEYIEFEVSP